MRTPARPTAASLQGLHTDWDTSAHQALAADPWKAGIPLHQLDHPIIRKAAEDFPAEERDSHNLRESISGLSNPVWWKVKIGARWRGAVFEDSNGQAWLCAVGYRRGGEDSDFYKEFMRQVQARGAASFMPTEADEELRQKEIRGLKLASWEREVAHQARAGCRDAIATGEPTVLELEAPTGDPLASLVLEAVEVDSLLEIVVSVEVRDWAHADVRDWLELASLAAIRPEEQRWEAYPVGGLPTFSTVVDLEERESFEAALSDEVQAALVLEAGQAAHFTHKLRLVENTVEGRGVQALCGRWFVPRQDHMSLQECTECAAIHRLIPEAND